MIGAGLGPAFDPNGDPFIRFRCLVPRSADCADVQRIRCATDWVQLPLLPRTTGLHQASATVITTRRATFTMTAFATASSRERGAWAAPTIRHVEAHQLRCSVTVLLNWFRVSLRHGWLDSIELAIQRNTSGTHARYRICTKGIGNQLLAEFSVNATKKHSNSRTAPPRDAFEQPARQRPMTTATQRAPPTLAAHAANGTTRLSNTALYQIVKDVKRKPPSNSAVIRSKHPTMLTQRAWHDARHALIPQWGRSSRRLRDLRPTARPRQQELRVATTTYRRLLRLDQLHTAPRPTHVRA